MDFIQKTIRNLQKNNMGAFLVENETELISLLSKLIPQNSVVGCGDSVTLEQMHVFNYLRANTSFLDKYDPSITSQEKRQIYLNNFSADTFISGSNAITHSGEIFNIDGNGSRVAPIIYGPKQVIIVVGKNKLAENKEKAIQRASQIAAPLDAKRLCKDTPCTKLGTCINCHHEQRICNSFVLISGQFQKDRIKVIIVNQNLGF